VKKKDLLADKLVAGTAEASRSAVWWPKHSLMIGTHLGEAWGAPNRRESETSIIRVGQEWDILVGDGAGMMAEHSALEIGLVDAAGDADCVAIDQIQSALEENLKKQQSWHVNRLQNFPERTFVTLMRDHIRLFLEAVIHKMDCDRRKLLLCEGKRGHNAVSIGMLMTEWV
jgi:hypothetical protein